jgi:hypothetical protein
MATLLIRMIKHRTLLRQVENLYNRAAVVIISLFPCLLQITVLGQDEQNIEPNFSLTATPMVVDIGDHPAWARTTAEFILHNGTKRAVSIAKVRTSCGCAKAAIPKGEVKPGESAKLVVEIKPNTLRGPYTKHVFVHWRELAGNEAANASLQPKTRLMRLTVRGNAKPLVTVRPGRTVALGQVPVGKAVERDLLLEAGPAELVLGKPEAPEGLVAKMVDKEVGPGGKLPLSVSVRPTKPGRFRQVLSIPVLLPKGQPPIGIVVHGTAVAEAGKADAE